MTVKERIAALRARMKETGIDAYLIPTAVSYTHLTFVYHKDENAPKAFLNFEGVDSCFYVWINGCLLYTSPNSPLSMKRLRAGIQIIIKVTITLASGKKQVISITVQKTTVRTIKITGLKSSVTVARNKKLTLKPVISPITSQEKVTYLSLIHI